MFREKIILTKEECTELIKLCKDYKPSPIYNKNSGVYLKHSRRISEQSKFSDLEKVKKILLPKLKEYNIWDLPDTTHIIRYNEGSYFKRHKDRGGPFENRKYTLIIQLSNIEDYEGADLIVHNSKASKQIGNLILFDSGIQHEVTELTKGKRYVLVSWITDNEYRNSESQYAI